MSSAATIDSARQPPTRGVRLTAVLFACVGVAARLAPLFNQDGRLFRQFPTEDGYLMLTIARALALGQGMSTSNGTIPTNGVQPGFCFLQAALFSLVGGERVAGVELVLVAEILIASATAFGLYHLIDRVLETRVWGRSAALLAATGWYASAVAIPHTMNCLETGLYVLAIVWVLLGWHRFVVKVRGTDRAQLGGALGVGALLGFAFWARIDAVFLIGSVALTHVALAAKDRRSVLKARVTEALALGVVAVVAASPWLLFNKTRFGHFMPISGAAQSYGSTFGSNVLGVPAKLSEYAAVFVPIPHQIETVPGALALWSALVLAYVVLAARLLLRASTNERPLAGVTALYVTCLVGYYGLLFGAPYFIGRYLFPVSLFFAGITASLGFLALARLPERAGALLGGAVLGVCVLLCAALGVRAYKKGTEHEHFQVVEWTSKHIPEQAWVGAVQTGTLGFFHDRTVNLDGKVNPTALIRLLERRIPEYVADERFGPEHAAITYLIDWQGIASWKDLPPIRAHFDLVVDDAALNLAVLKRRDSGTH